MAADPQFVLPYEQLAGLAAQAQNWPGPRQHERRPQLDPDGTPQLTYYDAGRVRDGQERRAASRRPPRPWPLIPATASSSLKLYPRCTDPAGGLRSGAPAHESYLSYMPAGTHVDMVKQEIAQPEPRSAFEVAQARSGTCGSPAGACRRQFRARARSLSAPGPRQRSTSCRTCRRPWI